MKNLTKASCNRSYLLKTYTPNLYTWSPPCNNPKKNLNENGYNGNPYFCTATAGSQGQDWTTGYVYDFVVINYQQEHLAYVECNYVK